MRTNREKQFPSNQLRVGRNQLAIGITNNWNNRLVADTGLEPEKRLSHISKGCGFHAKSPLQASGLIGPVWIQQAGDAGGSATSARDPKVTKVFLLAGQSYMQGDGKGIPRFDSDKSNTREKP